MLDWIAGYVARWTGYVATGVIDLVHWGIHALAGVVYGVFGNVGKAWHLFTGGLAVLRDYADRFVSEVVTLADWIIRVAIPGLYRQALAWYHDALNLAKVLYHAAIVAIDQALRLAKALIEALRTYVDVHVLAPLTDLIRQLRADLLRWGYVAWFYVTHPEKLAPVLIDAIVAAAIAAFDRIAIPAGEFALRLVARDPRRWLQLLEHIIAAVL